MVEKSERISTQNFPICLSRWLSELPTHQAHSRRYGYFWSIGACFARHGGLFPAWPRGNGMAGRPAGSRRQPVF